jgi:DeoR/GlpR family transcriptional regulator of sugar metabolism
MFGDKGEKRVRLERVLALVAQAEGGVRQAELAEALGVSRSTIRKDLATLDERGALLAEDDHGRISIIE